MRHASGIRSANVLLRAGLSLALAGTCFAVPGLALASESATESDAETVAAAEADSEAVDEAETTAIVSSGVQIEVPADYAVTIINDDLASAVSADGSVAVALSNESIEGFPADEAEQDAWFLENCQAEADIMDATLEDASSSEVNGLSVYTGQYTLADGAVIIFTYVPMEDGTVTALNVYVDLAGEDELALAAGREIAGSIAAADQADDADADAAADAAVEEATLDLTQTVESCGITFGLPEDVQADPEVDSTWASVDGAFVVAVDMTFTPDEAAEMTEEDFAQAAENAADLMDGEVYIYMTTDTGGATVYTYFMVIPVNEEELGVEAYMIVESFVPVADGSVTTLTMSCDIDNAEAYAETMGAIIESIALA